jgi:diaminopimelate decarboxylase
LAATRTRPSGWSTSRQARDPDDGLLFHAGSQLVKPDKYVEAIDTCGRFISEARARGFALEVLDIGGGFPIDYRNRCPRLMAIAPRFARRSPDCLTAFA